MKLWIDVLTPKQVHFFRFLVEELRERGFEVLVTARDYRELTGLLQRFRFPAEVVGQHGGGGLQGKLEASLRRAQNLSKLVKKWRVKAALSFSSPECARVAFGLNLPHIAVNDSPHATAVARLTIPLSTHLLSPWLIPYSAWTRFGIAREKITRYHALDPAVWLKRWRGDGEAARHGLTQGRYILVRPEEKHAAYLRGVRDFDYKALAEALRAKLPDYELALLPRYSEQASQLKQVKGVAHIIDSAVDGPTLIAEAALFIGRGGTMTAEAALLGTPTISLYPGSPTYVENYLIRSKLVHRSRTIREAVFTAYRLISDGKARRRIQRRAHRLLASMEDPCIKITKVVEAVVKR